MITKELSDIVMSIGCASKVPRGGVVQVVHNYSRKVYLMIRCVTNSVEGGKIRKLWQMGVAQIKTFSLMLFDRRIHIMQIHMASYNRFRQSACFKFPPQILQMNIVLNDIQAIKAQIDDAIMWLEVRVYEFWTGHKGLELQVSLRFHNFEERTVTV